MFTYDKDFIKELSIFLAKDFSKETWLNSIGKTYTGVMTGDNVGIFSQGDFKDVVVASCNPEFTSPRNITSNKWKLNNFGIYKEFCFDDLLPELKRQQSLYNLTDIEAANTWMTQYVEKAYCESIIAKSFFASTEPTDNVTAGLNGIDGILPQMINMVSGGLAEGSQVVPVATNTKTWGKTGTNAVDVIEELIDAAPASVKASTDQLIIMTQAMYDSMRYNLVINKGIYVSEQWTSLFNGLKETSYNGIRVVVIPELDGIINQLQSGDQFYQKPLLAIYTTKDNILFGSQSDNEAGIVDLDIFDDKRSQSTCVAAKYSLGVHIATPDFSIAY